MSFTPDGARFVAESTARLAGSGPPLVTDSKTFVFDDSGRYLLTSALARDRLPDGGVST